MVASEKRRYWVVSPNVRYNEKTVSEWRQASVMGHAAFMGWRPEPGHGTIGHKFAYEIQPDDIILIARRHRGEPEIVGFGVVRGKFRTRLPGVKIPDERFASLRKLEPFVPQSRAPKNLNLMDALGHTMALAKLHPDRNEAHARVCRWMERKLKKSGNSEVSRASENKIKPRKVAESDSARIAAPPGNHQLDYNVRTKRQIIKAQKIEAKLVENYRIWLKQQDRILQSVKYKNLQCDGFEEERNNLIEAKSSTSREHIRMAVGQLLDYGFQGRKKFGRTSMAILVPQKPRDDIEDWLASLKISVIWSEKQSFLDNANGKFT